MHARYVARGYRKIPSSKETAIEVYLSLNVRVLLSLSLSLSQARESPLCEANRLRVEEIAGAKIGIRDIEAQSTFYGIVTYSAELAASDIE